MDNTASLEISLLIPAKGAAHCLEQTTHEAHRYLSERFQDSFEILLIPTTALEDPAIALAARMSQELSHTRFLLHSGPVGKGAALKTGVLASQGRFLFLTDADLPYDLCFFDQAYSLLHAEGFDFVTGNRRTPESHFNIPVPLLPLAYRRHRLGLLFNRFVRMLFPVRTEDTQAGIKAMRRGMALTAFNQIQCPGFLFDIELFLTALAHGFRHKEIPVTLHLKSEKTTIRLVREVFISLYWLFKIFRSWKKKYYHPIAQNPLPHFRELNPFERIFLWARWKWTPYRAMARLLPKEETILDLGCGHGLMSLALSENATQRKILGVDHDARRIALAREAAKYLPQVEFQTGDFSILNQNSEWGGMTFIDVLHYFPLEEQRKILQKSFQNLKPGGKLLFREVDREAGRNFIFNRFHETLMTKFKFTKASALHFRSVENWKRLAEESGFKVATESQKRFPFADVLFICERPVQTPGQ